MQLEILANGHAVGDGLDGVVVVVDAIVEDGADDEVFARLDIKKTGIELGKDMLDGQGRITRTSGQIDPILHFLIELRPHTTADALVDVAVLAAQEGDDGDLLLRNAKEGGIGAT